MKKIALLAIACVFCIAAAVWFLNRPATVTIQPVLTAGGLVAPEDVQVFVGVVREDAPTGELDIANIDRIYPREGGTDQYDLPLGREIGVVTAARGLGYISERFVLQRGNSDRIEVVLDAAQLTVQVLSSPNLGQVRVQNTAEEGIGPEVGDDGTLTYFLPTGTYTFEGTQDLNTARDSVSVAAGERVDLILDTRLAEVTLAIDAFLPWSDDWPEARISLTGMDQRRIEVADSAGRVRFDRLPYGMYEATVELGPTSSRAIFATQTAPVTFDIKAAETDVAIPLGLNVVRLDLSALDPANLVGAEAILMKDQDFGLAYAAVNLIDAAPTLVFVPPNKTGGADNVVLFIARGNDILAVVDMPELMPDTPLDLIVERGAGLDRCVEIAGEENCALMVP